MLDKDLLVRALSRSSEASLPALAAPSPVPGADRQLRTRDPHIKKAMSGTHSCTIALLALLPACIRLLYEACFPVVYKPGSLPLSARGKTDEAHVSKTLQRWKRTIRTVGNPSGCTNPLGELYCPPHGLTVPATRAGHSRNHQNYLTSSAAQWLSATVSDPATSLSSLDVSPFNDLLPVNRCCRTSTVTIRVCVPDASQYKQCHRDRDEGESELRSTMAVVRPYCHRLTVEGIYM